MFIDGPILVYKPHMCPYFGCGKCFSDSSSRARHRRIHINDKPYICKNPQCRKAFCWKTTMTKHFRKEHPADSIDQEEDADYSNIEQSDDEQSLDQKREDSPDSMEYPKIKSETPVNAAASNYNANLWRLPGQTAQPSHHHASMTSDHKPGVPSHGVKMERSLSGTRQRQLTDPTMNNHMGQVRNINTRANTLPTNMSCSPSVSEIATWQAQQMHESPTDMTHPQSYPMQGIPVPTSAPGQFQPQTLPIRRPNLQPAHDIILNEPQQSPYPQPPQQYYAALPNP